MKEEIKKMATILEVYHEVPFQGPEINSAVPYDYPSLTVYAPKGDGSPGWPHQLTGTDLYRSSTQHVIRPSLYRYSDVYTELWEGGRVLSKLITARGRYTYAKNVGYGFLGPFVEHIESFGDDFAKVKNKAISRCVEEANSSTYNIFEDIAESAETLQLFIAAAKALRSPVATLKTAVAAYEKFCRRNGFQMRNPFQRGAARYFGASLPKATELFLDCWMTWRYGIMTILYSVRDAHKAIDDIQQKKLTYSYRASAYGQNEETLMVSSQNEATVGQLRERRITTYAVRVTITDRIILDAEGIPYGAIHYASLRSVPKTLWDISKWSWVIDWFCNTGAKVASLTGNPSSVSERIVTVAETTTVTSTGLVGTLSRQETYNAGHYQSVISGKLDSKGEMTTRKIYDREVSFDTPSVTLMFDPYINMKRLIDAAALLKNLLSKR